MKRVAIAALCLWAASIAVAEDGGIAQTAEDLKAGIATYDKNNGGDTMGIERDIIKLRDLGAAKELRETLPHKRFGFLAAWALSDLGVTEAAPEVLKAFLAVKDPLGRIEWSVSVGGFATDEVRAALKAEIPKANGMERDAYRAALLRTRDPGLEKETLAAMDDKDPEACAKALLLAGNARRDDLLPRFAALAKDARAVPGNRKSSFGVEVRKETENGWTSSNKFPELKTVGDYAVEAASLSVNPTTPDMVAWWYEVELTPRFPLGDPGRALLAEAAAAVEKAGKTKAKSLQQAVAAVIREARAADEDKKVLISGVAFADRWEIRFRRKDSMAKEAGAEITAYVDADGKVSDK